MSKHIMCTFDRVIQNVKVGESFGMSVHRNESMAQNESQSLANIFIP